MRSSIISAPAAFFTIAWGINDAGQIVGTFSDGAGTHGFVRDGGAFTSIDGPEAFFTEATGINNRGQIVGNFFGPSGFHGFLKEGDSLTTIEVPGSTVTEVHGINSAGQIVGTFRDANNVAHGFVKDGGNFAAIDVPDAIPPNFNQAKGIDDLGRVVGWFEDVSGVHAFVATPTTTTFEALKPKLVLSRGNPGHDLFLLKGSLTLGEEGNGIDPVFEPVVVSIGDFEGTFFSQTLPPGSFRQAGRRGFVFLAPEASAGIHQMTLTPTKRARTYAFEALGRRLDLSSANSPPVTILLQIGNDLGSETIPCQELEPVLICR